MTKISLPRTSPKWKLRGFLKWNQLNKLILFSTVSLIFIFKQYVTLRIMSYEHQKPGHSMRYKMIDTKVATTHKGSKPPVAYFNGGKDFVHIPLDLRKKYTKLMELKPFLRQDENDSNSEFNANHETSLFLDNEKDFSRTLKSCISSKCLHRTYQETNVNRIAILAPPGAIADRLFDILNYALDTTFDPNSSPKKRDMFELVRTTHVPPYGYGGNHGWTKIIRLVISPLPSAIADVMLAYEQGPQAAELKKKEDPILSNDKSPMERDRIQTTTEAVLRQVIRFHARLSHVAAHTKMLTIDLSSMERDYGTALQNMMRLILFDNENKPIIEEYDDKSSSPLTIELKEFNNAIDNADTYASKIISSDWQIGLLEDILREELSVTGNLKAWPCKSFWDIRSYIIKDLTSIPYQAARAMAPKCDDEHVTCTIQKDLCEVIGKIECD